MRKLIFAGSLLLVPAAAGAADLPYQRPVAQPAPVYKAPAPYFDWTGFYVGVNGGWAGGRSRFDFEGAGLGADHFHTRGWQAGGTTGYNVQLGGVVFGLEGDLDWSNVNGSGTCPTGLLCQTQNNWLGTARGRVGYAFGNVLPYVTGGLAVGDIKASVPGVGSASTTNAGWTAGGGLEYGISRNWSAKMEYLHVNLGSFDCGTACDPTPPVNVRASEDLVRAGLNYKFDWGGGR
jgi:outer membrane immunogenic protein